MGFSLSAILPAALAVGGSLLASGISESKTAGPKGYMKKSSSTSLGFLGDIIGSGAKAYVESPEDDDDFGVPEMETPRIQRFSGQAPRSGLSPAMENPRVQLALQNIFNRINNERNLQQMVRDSGVPMTTRGGRRTIGLEAPQTPSATKTKIASVQTASEE